jgi:hypothetical protein
LKAQLTFKGTKETKFLGTSTPSQQEPQEREKKQKTKSFLTFFALVSP